ncbi:MAG: hypothetical protein KIT11_08460 [Fimbriimonadaceae bacterium]|nr:hypothetical protein [Fimbriimonadaceae bacterium]QYK56385.1 MAG: hypothetical protein KF733_02655 [Fimbriimonadaceae bacterium]
MTTIKVPWWAVASLVATALLAVAALIPRYRVEAGNRAVGVLMDAETVRQFAAVSNTPLNDALRDLAAHGLTGIAITEDTVAGLVAAGELTLSPLPSGDVLIQGSDLALARVVKGIAWQGGLGSDMPSGKSALGGVYFTGDKASLATTSVGIDPSLARKAKEAGLAVVARHVNTLGAGPSYIRAILDDSAQAGAIAFLPAGDVVLGFRSSLEDTGVVVQDDKLQYLAAEFVKTVGDSRIQAEIPGSVVRLHSMQQAEADRSSPGAVVERYAKAFRERNIRWLLVRPPVGGSQEPLKDADRFLNSLKNAVVHEGGAVRVPRPFEEPVWNPWYAVGIVALAAPLLAWTAQILWPLKNLGLFSAGVVLALALGSVSPSLREVASLALAVGFPLAGYALVRALRAPPLAGFAIATYASLVGGLAVAGCNVGLLTMLQVEQFTGIKVAVFLPVVVVAVRIALDQASPRDWAQRPILWGTAVLGVVGLAAMAFMLARTGNENPAGVSGAELQFRALLDRFLPARPRTKEFLIGHPAFLLGLTFASLARTRPKLEPWAGALLVVGMVGQTSVLNTLCHFHSPLDLAVVRIATGWVIGGILGLLLSAVLRQAVKRQESGPVGLS